jgi:hypothetical protein
LEMALAGFSRKYLRAANEIHELNR